MLGSGAREIPRPAGLDVAVYVISIIDVDDNEEKQMILMTDAPCPLLCTRCTRWFEEMSLLQL